MWAYVRLYPAGLQALPVLAPLKDGRKSLESATEITKVSYVGEYYIDSRWLLEEGEVGDSHHVGYRGNQQRGICL